MLCAMRRHIKKMVVRSKHRHGSASNQDRADRSKQCLSADAEQARNLHRTQMDFQAVAKCHMLKADMSGAAKINILKGSGHLAERSFEDKAARLENPLCASKIFRADQDV